MVRSAPVFAIIISIIASVLGYLLYIPHSEGVAQLNRIRVISAAMKTIKFVGQVSEVFGLSTEVQVQRDVEYLLERMKPEEEDRGLEIEDTTIDGVSVRIYRPLQSVSKVGELRPALLYFHGGAFYLGSYVTHNAVTTTIARDTGFIVISVHYRLAPEHPFPAGVDDCTTVTKHVLNKSNAKQLGIDHERVAIGGDSAGGNFGAVIAMRLATDDDPHNSPRLLVLIYPLVQFFDFQLPSFVQPSLSIFHLATMSDVLRIYFNNSIRAPSIANRHTSIEQKQKFRSLVDWALIPDRYRQVHKASMSENVEGDPELVNGLQQALNPDASPLLVDNAQLAKLPPTYLLTVEHDALRDEALIYGARLKASGVQLVHHHFDRAFHGSLTFLHGPLGLDIAHEMLNDVIKYLKDNL